MVIIHLNEDVFNCRPNDLVAVGPDQFIYTNDGIAQSEIGNFFEMITRYNGASVYYWNGKVFSAKVNIGNC